MFRQSKDNYFPAEWEEQDAVLIAWPHFETDWRELLAEVTDYYVGLAEVITQYEKLVVLCHDRKEVARLLSRCDASRLQLVETNYNDTWARDFGPLSVVVNQQLVLTDYKFNGWGGQFEASADNGVTKTLFDQRVFADAVGYRSRLDFILEGGSIESNGQGLLLTTSRCLLAQTRNCQFSRHEIEQRLKADFFLDKVLWLENGQLQGDDTDGHVDTLARFCDVNTIAYVACDDESDIHFSSLQLMKKELRRLTNQQGEPISLIPLPMVPAIYGEDGKRLAATYANFLIINDAVLLPVYGVATDVAAIAALQTAFPEREVVAIHSRILTEWGGSLHCSTMQLFKGSLAQ